MAELNYTMEKDFESTFDVIPAGDYAAIIEESDLKVTKAGTGKYLSLKYQIIDGEYKGRLLFENLNISNPSPQAEQIARRALNSICAAVDVQNVTDSSDLHNIPMIITVGIKKDAQYGDGNIIKKHTALQEGVKKEVQKEKKSAKNEKHPWEK